jgi:pSer/pThr/pTyr-binding forkhead associated (FHA) protein
MVKLIIEDDEGKTTVVPLIRDEITIGRKEGNTIRLTERNVSRRHAKLLKQNGAIFIEDLNSYNGIKVNGNKIAGRVAITEGDRIQIGDYVLGLKMEGAELVLEAGPTGAKTLELPRSAEIATTQLPAETVGTAVEAAEPPPAPAPAPVPPPVAPREPLKVEHAGRLVCVSTNFPGQEWVLNKPLMVIGRTEENDCVVNHRSISRHHARITEENGRYTIVDLQSSNGVRVNGEEYGKVELRRGDLIDLGHVRLRFVAAGEDFVFSRDASVVDISKIGGSRGGLWAGLSVAVVLIVGGLIWYFSRTPPPPHTNTDVQSGATGDAQRGGVGADPLIEINTLTTSEQWAAILKLCDQLKAEQRAGAQSSCDRARLEKDAKERFDKANDASLQHKPKTVLELWAEIPAESAYKKRDLEMIEKAKKEYGADAKNSLKEAITAQECEKAKTIAAELKRLLQDSEGEQAASECKPLGMAKKIDVVRPPPKKHKIPVVKLPPKKKDEPRDAAQATALLKQAQESYVSGNHSRAILLGEQALKADPGNKQAIQIIGASACYVKNERKARWAFERLPTATRNVLKAVCGKAGINLE